MAKYSKNLTLGYNADGKRIRKRIYSNSEAELKKKERETLMEADKELQSNLTFGKYKEKWFQTYKSNKAPSTQYMYRYALRKLSPLDGKRLKDITRSDIQQLVNENYDHPRAAQTIVLAARQILESAMADNLIAPKYLKIDLPKSVKREKRAFTDTEKDAIRKASLDPQERLFVDIAFYLGLRPEEIRGLQPRDFDLKERTLTVSRACALDIATNSAVIKSTKTSKPRSIPVPDILIAEIRRYNASFSGFYYFTDKQGALFTYGKYKSFTDRIFRAINEALGGNDKLNLLNGMTMYTFRHNRATELYYLQGVSTKKKAEYMGHSEIMFLKTYSHLDDEKEELELLRQVNQN